LKGMGVAEVFTPGSSLAGICKWLGDTLDEREEVA
jgi:methylmalonyl-CoA mutase cobalamin-binding subunit